MFFKKKQKIRTIIRISLLFTFLLVSIKSSIFALSQDFNSGKNTNKEKTIIMVEGSTCGLDNNSCCCENTTANHNCCCKSEVADDMLLKNKREKNRNSIFSTFISSLKLFWQN